MRLWLVAAILISCTAHAGIVRQNVRTLSKSGSTGLIGDVTLSEGSNVTLTQVGQDITISASGGSASTGEIKTASYTLVSGDNAKFFYYNSTASGVFTLPDCDTNDDFYATATQIGIGPLTVESDADDPMFDGDNEFVFTVQGQSYGFACKGGNYHVY